MGKQTFEVTYHHDNDCVVSGCPSHTAKLTYHSVSDYITFDDGYGENIVGMDLNTLRAFLDLLGRFEYRVEIKSALRVLKQTTTKEVEREEG